jgi:exodeoxyribonuclease V
MELSLDQRVVFDDVVSWMRNPTKQYVTLGGYAGTGKTTLSSFIRKEIKRIQPDLKVAFCAFTGMASWVLKSKLRWNNAIYPGLDSCSTIHRLIYNPVIDSDTGEILRWIPADEIFADMLIIDEASMVSREIFQDLLGFGKPIIAIGDHGQLPPIGDNFNLMDNPMFRLEKIHRQAEKNPIIKISKIVREEGRFPGYSEWGDFLNGGGVKRIRKRDKDSEIVDKLFEKFDNKTMVLAGTNRMRLILNDAIRQSLNINSVEPIVGDRVICLKNNGNAKNIPIFNGMRGNIQEINSISKDHYNTTIKMDGEKERFIGVISKHFFSNEYGEEPKGVHFSEIGNRFDFGYCITVHKAQGSESDTVILFERPKWQKETQDMYIRWLYTGVTRAVENLLIIN